MKSVAVVAALSMSGVESFSVVPKPNGRIVTRPSIKSPLQLWRDHSEDDHLHHSVEITSGQTTYSGALFGGDKSTIEECMTMKNAQTCMNASGEDTCSVEEMMYLMEELERKNNDCTEECNQTSRQCGIEVKEQRDMMIENLSNQIQSRQNKTTSSKTVTMTADAVVDETDLMVNVETCLATQGVSYTLDEMVSMLNELELINSDCTEECHQTEDYCDPFQKEERELKTEKLALLVAKIRTPTHKAKSTISSVQDCVEISKTQTNHKGPSEACYSDTTLEDMRIMLNDLEVLNSDCTEEGHQTDAECDVHVKEERDMFMEYLRIGISLLEEKEKNEAKTAAAVAAGLVPPPSARSSGSNGNRKVDPNVEYFI